MQIPPDQRSHLNVSSCPLLATCIYPGVEVFKQVRSGESAGKVGHPGLIPGVGKIPWRRKRQPTPVFLPGESRGPNEAPDGSTGSQRVGHD